MTEYSEWGDLLGYIRDDIIELDSRAGKLLGFTSDLFDGYLWKTRDIIYISAIISRSPKNGHLKHLFSKIEALGYAIQVPNPLPTMIPVLKHLGFKPRINYDPEYGSIDVWIK
jgi:hypothetical protein